jgi:O-antigen/teichoic acid export membrane protein
MVLRSRTRATKWTLVSRYITFFLAIVQGIILVPLYLQFIPLDMYGAWLASGNLLALIAIMDPGFTVVLQQQIALFYGKKDISHVSALIGSGLIGSFILLLITIIVGLIVAYYLPVWLSLPSAIDTPLLVKAFKLAVIGSALTLFSFAISAINLGLLGSIVIGAINNGLHLISIALTIFLLFKGYGLMALPICLVFNGIFYTLFHLLYLFWRIYSEKIGVSFSVKNMLSLSKLLSFTFLSRAGGAIANNIDLIFVSRFIGPEVVASLALTRKPIDLSKEIINLPVASLQAAISHLAGSGEMDKARKILLRLIFFLIWASFLISGGVISFNADFINLWVGNSLFVGKPINFLFSFGAFLAMITQSAALLSLSLGNIKGNSIANLAQALLYIFLVFIGTKYFGLYGLVLSPIISMLVITTWYHPLSVARLVNFSQNDIKDVLYQGFLAVVLIIPQTLIFSHTQPKSWLLFSFCIIIYCLLYVASLFMFSKEFKYQIQSLFNKK